MAGKMEGGFSESVPINPPLLPASFGYCHCRPQFPPLTGNVPHDAGKSNQKASLYARLS